ncbi:hypothetical protein [Pantoea sp. SOD02]|uniref:hypothetical protein n=1 Tax=Pantoea sp. SOD02 TaxID=2970818 RepID=UPI0021570020|nr:hypothetical protein [Pantoea sp. SOD02]UVC32048.1 hypothetical protein NR302_21010 [Pantoea sp. SOD02]
MELKEILDKIGLTVPQLFTAIPVLLLLSKSVLKTFSYPFKLIDLISENVYAKKTAERKVEAIDKVFSVGTDNENGFADELKIEVLLYGFGLKYPIYTLKIFFIYIHKHRDLNYQSSAYDF